jgi:DNA-binding transcriptional ArsR family regulator
MGQEAEMLRAQLDQLQGRVNELAAAIEQGKTSSKGGAERLRPGTTEKDLAEQLMASLPEEGMSAAIMVGLVLGNRHSGWQFAEIRTPIGSEGDVGEAARIFSALGNEMRLKLLQLLWDGERTAQDLTEGTGLTQGAVYHHVRELSALRWVESPRRNTYSITPLGRQALVCAWEFTNVLGILGRDSEVAGREAEWEAEQDEG